jgi:hypothetical protein
VRVPDEAATQGKVQITLSFPDWKEGKVAPFTYEVPLVPNPDESGKKGDETRKKR